MSDDSAVQTIMPPLTPPSSLSCLCERSVEAIVAKCGGQHEVTESWLTSAGQTLLPSFAEKLVDRVVNDEKHLCCVHFVELLSPKIKKIRFEHYYECDNECLKRFLREAAARCTNLQQISISKHVTQNLNEEFQEFCENIDHSKVKSITLKTSSLEDVNLQNMSSLEHLDISGISVDDGSLKHILKMKSLRSLMLNNCKLSTIQALQILTGNSFLRQFECSFGKQSRVIQALSSLPRGTFLNLEQLSFRSPPRPSFYDPELLKMLKKVKSVNIKWNISEVGYSSAIDEGLIMLEKMVNVTQISFEIEMINLLYIIQLGDKLSNIAQNITNMEFFEPELVHPASLDFVGSLINLKHLKIINPMVIGL